MSGGHFEHKQYTISYIADEVEGMILSNDDTTLDEWGCYPRGRGFKPEVIEEFKKGLRVLREAFIYAQRIDWLVSGDDGEEGFLKRLEDELRGLK
jgi:hypothetical protein